MSPRRQLPLRQRSGKGPRVALRFASSKSTTTTRPVLRSDGALRRPSLRSPLACGRRSPVRTSRTHAGTANTSRPASRAPARQQLRRRSDCPHWTIRMLGGQTIATRTMIPSLSDLQAMAKTSTRSSVHPAVLRPRQLPPRRPRLLHAPSAPLRGQQRRAPRCSRRRRHRQATAQSRQPNVIAAAALPGFSKDRRFQRTSGSASRRRRLVLRVATLASGRAGAAGSAL